MFEFDFLAVIDATLLTKKLLVVKTLGFKLCCIFRLIRQVTFMYKVDLIHFLITRQDKTTKLLKIHANNYIFQVQ